MDPGARGPDETGRDLAFAVAMIVALGAALGVGFHSLRSSADARRDLPWIARETPIVSLESFQPRPGVPLLPESTFAVPHAVAPARATAPPQARPAPAVTKAAPTPAAPGSGKPALPAPATAAAPAPKPAEALPFVPDTGAPLEVQYATTRRFWDAGGALIVDARPGDEYAAGHIPGAVNLPFDDVQRNPDLARQLDTRGRAVVITYCGGGTCDLSKDLAQALIEAGRRKVLVFTGGLPGWQEAGAPVATGYAPGEAP